MPQFNFCAVVPARLVCRCVIYMTELVIIPRLTPDWLVATDTRIPARASIPSACSALGIQPNSSSKGGLPGYRMGALANRKDAFDECFAPGA